MLSKDEVLRELAGHQQMMDDSCFPSALEMVLKLQKKRGITGITIPNPSFLQDQYYQESAQGMSDWKTRFSYDGLIHDYPQGLSGLHFSRTIVHNVQIPHLMNMMAIMDYELDNNREVIIESYQLINGEVGIHAHVVYSRDDMNGKKQYHSITGVPKNIWEPLPEAQRKYLDTMTWDIKKFSDHLIMPPMDTPHTTLRYWTYHY